MINRKKSRVEREVIVGKIASVTVIAQVGLRYKVLGLCRLGRPGYRRRVKSYHFCRKIIVFQDYRYLEMPSVVASVKERYVYRMFCKEKRGVLT